MREIKFRAWDKFNKRMGGVVGIDFFPLEIRVTFGPDLEWESFENNNDFVLMQYTGSDDKNGKKIYEGDILTFPESPTNKILYGVAEFKDSAYRWIEKPINGIQPCLNSLWRGNIEIIGNIYEHSELLKGDA